jgi:hypothetical protein
VGENLPEQLKVFAENVRTNGVGQSRHVTARSREARDQFALDRIIKTDADDGDRLCCLFGCQRGWRRRGDNNIDPKLDQFIGEVR